MQSKKDCTKSNEEGVDVRDGGGSGQVSSQTGGIADLVSSEPPGGKKDMRRPNSDHDKARKFS